MISIADFINKVEVQEPVIYKNLAVSRIMGDDVYKIYDEQNVKQIETVDDALKTRFFSVSELDPAHQYRLEVKNGLERKVFIPSGAILESENSQNRAVAFPMLVHEGGDGNETRTIIPVFCAQRGQPCNDRAEFKGHTTIMKASGRTGFTPAPQRGNPDQTRTWATIAMSTRIFHINEDNRSDYVTVASQIPVQEYMDRIGGWKEHQLGYVAAVMYVDQDTGERNLFFYSDILGNQQLFRNYYDKILKSVTVVAKESGDFDFKIRTDSMEQFLDLAKRSEIVQEEQYAGDGEAYRMRNPVDGSLLYHCESPVQYAMRKDVFAVDKETNRRSIIISPGQTMILDGDAIRERLRRMRE
jgi:hypothetical protein